MFNPYPYDDPAAINRPELSSETINSIISGTKETASYISDLLIEKLKSKTKNPVIALEGYISTQWEQTVNLISQNLRQKSVKVKAINFAKIYKSGSQLDEELSSYLKENREKDPVLLFGKLFKGSYEDLLDNIKLGQLETLLKETKDSDTGEVTIIYGCGCAIQRLRPLYDWVCYFDVTPKEVMLRARKGLFANLGDNLAKPIKALLRRCYYVDFEVAMYLRGDLIKKRDIDYYIASTNSDNLQLIPWTSFDKVMSSLVKYPMRCKPVYLEGVWGGHYIKRLRNLPAEMRNCAWVFDMIPLEVSIVVEAGKQLLEFPFFTFVQTEGPELMGQDCVNEFGGYFPIRFNYDDSYHSSGNMSIQLHSDHKYNVENYGEHCRQDESYYVITTGHGAKTYIGFNEDADPDEFIREAKKSEKEFTPVDYQKYINHVESKPGTQVMIPAGTIHSSGRNQVVLEIGSLTVGSYTYKMYDYLRADFDGKPRPIHTYHGERQLRKERKTQWVKENLVQDPQLVRSGNGWAEYIVGEHDLLYFSLRRFEFENSIEDNTNGKFHVLNLVDGEKVVIRSLDNPELSYTQNYLDMVIVPANVGRYVVKNLGNQPVCVHKTMLKDGFSNEELFID
ncbi:phosphoheptose isomerase [Mariniphaga sediminis]|uniref:Phosphoheptose isomerase n=1 Tax=Mariniphaga sediminis TaxID=1628158 RepID=A0A399D7R8_9BACT|nr:phosphoheptose isomerase [Mariniphaga sediminis]RIH67303.1 phosphoheptose isomerase [Mariniphaga sediminis]